MKKPSHGSRQKSGQKSGHNQGQTSSPFRLGILGGGQLARMLALEAHRLGIEVHILSASQEDPAAQVTSHLQHWPAFSSAFSSASEAANEQKLIAAFAEHLDALTFESEFIDAESLAKFLNKSSSPLQIYPSLASIGLLQDRASQKQTLQKHKLPTAPFILVEDTADLQLAWQELEGPFVLKKRRNSYDGNGTFYCRNHSNLNILEHVLKANSGGFIAEKMIRFRRECALVIVRSSDGSFAELPLIESHQVDSRCDWVLGPIQHPEQKKVTAKIKKMMAALGYVGALGIELFDTGKELLVNELAPRVHNSGHYSQDGLSQDQFTLHLLAGMGAPITSPKILAPAFGMVNLIGTGNSAKTADLLGAQLATAKPLKSQLHWYGKSESRKGRKMGHLNLIGSNAKAILKTLLTERKRFKI